MIFSRIILVLTLTAAAASAQSTRISPPSIGPVPPTPGTTVEPRQPEANVRHITYLTLSESRQWTSTDGRQILGKLIAFEEIVIERARGDAPPPQPELPENPTVVRDGKVRLLVDRKVSVVPLERLSEEDREFVEQIRVQREKRTGGGE